MRILLLFLLPLFSFGFDEMFEKALLKSPKILAKYEEVVASYHAADAYAVYKNPVVSIGINNLPLEENFLNRDIDSMQNEYIGITQEFDTFNKLGLKKSILKIDTLILEYELKDLKDKLYKNMAVLVEEIQAQESVLEKTKLKKQNFENLLVYYEKNITLDEALKSRVELSKKIFNLEDKIFEIQERISSLKHEFKYLTSNEFTALKGAKVTKDF